MSGHAEPGPSDGPSAARVAEADAAAHALVAVAPLATRWIERLLAAHTPTLTQPQYLALRAIGSGPVSVNELARRAGVSGSAASQLLSALDACGYVERRTVSDDRRRQQLVLTAAGAATLGAVEAMLTQRFAQLLAALPRPEIHALSRGLPFVEAELAGSAPPRRQAGPRPARAGSC